MLRLDDNSVDEINALVDLLVVRLNRLEANSSNTISGYTPTFVENTGKLTLSKGDVTITFTKD